MSYSIAPLLSELEALLDAEQQALICFDSDAVATIAERKLELDRRLTTLLSEASLPAIEQRDDNVLRLKNIKAQLLRNQLLIAHARSTIQGLLGLVTGAGAKGYSPEAKKHIPPPVSLNFRG